MVLLCTNHYISDILIIQIFFQQETTFRRSLSDETLEEEILQQIKSTEINNEKQIISEPLAKEIVDEELGSSSIESYKRKLISKR